MTLGNGVVKEERHPIVFRRGPVDGLRAIAGGELPEFMLIDPDMIEGMESEATYRYRGWDFEEQRHIYTYMEEQ